MKIPVSNALLLCASATLIHSQSARQGPPVGAASAASTRQALNTYCVTCHNSKLKTGGLSLDALDTTKIGENPELWDKVVRKLRAGMMPPMGARRPDSSTYE